MFLVNSSWALFAQIGKIIIQAGLFVLLARFLGAHDFGLYMAFFSIAQLCYPFSGLGTHNTMVMRVSRYPNLLKKYWGTPLVATLFFGGIASLLISMICNFFYSKSLFLLLFLFATELVFYRILDVATHAWQAKENLREGAIAYTALSMMRLLLVAILILSQKISFESWILSNFALTAVVSMIIFHKMMRQNNISYKSIKIYPREIYRGVYFSLAGTSQAINANVDKVMLSRLTTAGDVGVYSAAYKVVQMSFLPVMAVLQAAYPKFFQKGKDGILPALDVSKKLMPWLLLYSTLAGIGLYFTASMVPFILGKEYQQAIPYIQMLAVLPMIQVCHYLIGEALTGSGHQRARAISQLVAGGVNATLNVLLISMLGVGGAILSTLLAEVLLFIMYVFLTIIVRRLR